MVDRSRGPLIEIVRATTMSDNELLPDVLSDAGADGPAGRPPRPPRRRGRAPPRLPGGIGRGGGGGRHRHQPRRPGDGLRLRSHLRHGHRRGRLLGQSTAHRRGASEPSAIAAKVDPGLVDINVTFGLQGASGAATGMVLTPSGEVLTNNHVIDGATVISVTDIGNGRTYSATVVGYDRSRDVAVLQLTGASGLTTVPIGDSSTVTVGAKVTALGNAGGTGGTPSRATGRIIALRRSITAGDAGGGNFEHLTGLIETNAAIRPGDSGGPLVNVFGKVIAMDAAASAGSRLTSTATQGFAIPINQAVAISRQIEAGTGSSTVHIGPTAFLGVGIARPRPSAAPRQTGLSSPVRCSRASCRARPLKARAWRPAT